MIAIHQLDRLRLGSPLEHLGTTELEILDQDHAVSIGQHIPVGILDDATLLGSFRFGFLGPFKSTGDTLPLVRVGDHLIHGAFGTGRAGHIEKG